MNIAEITTRFVLLTGIGQEEVYKWRTLIDDAVSYITSVISKSELDENDYRRLDVLCAVYAFRLYQMCNEESISSFSVGDVRVSSPAGAKTSGEKLWREYAQISQDLIGNQKFLFGRVI